MAGLLLATGAHAAESAKPAATPARDINLRLAELEERAYQLYPRRRDTPLRYLNITDGEVREIQVIARKYEMPELMNISPVVEGCPCEEGSGCSEQVFIVGKIEDKAYGLQLSRRKNAWGVSTVQKWWLEHAALKARASTMDYRAYQKARERLLLEFPMCAPAVRSAVRSGPWRGWLRSSRPRASPRPIPSRCRPCRWRRSS